MKKIRNLTLVLIVIFVSSSFLRAQDASEKARSLAPKPDKSLVYVLRPSAYAFALRLPVDVDGKAIATLGAHDFGFIFLDPGKHSFKIVNGTSKATLFDLETEAGKVYFLEMQIKMGAISGRGVLVPMKEVDAKKWIGKCGLAKNNQEQL
jgi:hypothetical protein